MRASDPDRASYRHELQATYRYLRLSIILLTGLLGIAVGLQILADGGSVLPSVSAYYYTPARAVFVASLCAVGACMVIHRGRSDLEDVLLNFSGYLAFFVAFVPTARKEAVEGQGTAVIPEDFVAAVINNTWAILIVGALAFVVEMVVLPQRERSTGTRGGKAALVASALAYVGLLLFFLLARQSFLDWGHGLAAIVLFIGIMGVVGVNGIAMARARQEAGHTKRTRWFNRYTYGFLGMLVSAILIVVAVRPFVEQWVFVLEAALIAQFLGFWITQTVERWTEPEPRQDALVPG
ncbi:hypothetical protein [Pseudactinotalea terrae]|uniref:hypothetical protein n=1 Tax=Pseudactinotalea terrae TaxID=1743262 RepID=UPI0012E0FA62|nr:hypothetical protein [Pseudactinotalea terrae]